MLSFVSKKSSLYSESREHEWTLKIKSSNEARDIAVKSNTDFCQLELNCLAQEEISLLNSQLIFGFFEDINSILLSAFVNESSTKQQLQERTLSPLVVSTNSIFKFNE